MYTNCHGNLSCGCVSYYHWYRFMGEIYTTFVMNGKVSDNQLDNSIVSKCLSQLFNNAKEVKELCLGFHKLHYNRKR